MIGDLAEAFGRLGADPSVRAVVLEAEGKLFCSGADVAWMRRQAESPYEDNLADARKFAEMLRVIHECPKPTLAKVQGDAYGGGVGLLAAVDIVISAEGAKFSISEARLGILPAVIGPYILRALGPRQARRLAMTTESFGAADALRMGLVHSVVPLQELETAVENVVTALLKSGPNALSQIKQLFARIEGRAIDGAVREETAQTISRVRGTAEAKEGFAAFFAKRKPNWNS